jgi:hypothetical protein
MVSSSCSTTTSVLPCRPALGQRVQQHAVVARVQADGGLVQHVAHALQVAAQLRGQADALRLAAAERGRGAVQRQVAQAHLGQEARRLRISLSTSRAISASRLAAPAVAQPRASPTDSAASC